MLPLFSLFMVAVFAGDSATIRRSSVSNCALSTSTDYVPVFHRAICLCFA